MKIPLSLLGAGALLPAFAQLVSRQSNVDQSQKYVPSPGSLGFYAGNSSAAVTFDQHSLMLDGNRIMVFSGEFHPWRLPSIPLWRDILEKIKAGGFNTVSIYLHWGITEGKRGTLNFEGHRSVTTFLDVAKDVGVLVIVRPGPYINAETTGGGFPGWLTNIAEPARSNGSDFTAAWKPFMTAVSKFVAPYQFPEGPVILVQSENEFDMDSTAKYKYGHNDYMKWIMDTMRENGLDKVPITHNDYRQGGQFASGPAKVDLYGWDGYPLGFNCTFYDDWKEVDSTYDEYHQTLNPAEPLYLAEFQGGAFDTWGGSGTASCYQMVNEQFASVFYKNNYAAGTYLQSLYMIYGGTNWGNLATSSVYTSYDWGAAISEDRSLTAKYSELKLQGLFLHATPHYHLAGRISTGTSLSSSSQIFTTHLATLQGQNLYIARQTTNTNKEKVEFDLRVNTTGGEVILPGLSLDGRESKIIVSEYPFGKSLLKYSTAEIATWTTIDDKDHIVLYASNQNTTTALYTNSTILPSISASTSFLKATLANGTATVSGSLPASGLTRVTVGKTSLWFADKSWLAPRIWQPRVSGKNQTSKYDLSPRTGSVLVFGPYLVRNATIHGSILHVVGDLKSGNTTELEVIAPLVVTSITWNGKGVRVFKTAAGTLKGTIGGEDLTPKLPDLKDLEWRCTDSLPEIEIGFDDSDWVTANKTSTARPAGFQPLAGKTMLYADEYGYHQGNLLYRGRFEGNATGVRLLVHSGYNFGFSAFLNGIFLGSGQGRSNESPAGAITLINSTYVFPTGSVQSENVITVVIDHMGLNEDWGSNDEYKAPRGIRGYELLGGGDFSSWKLTGNVDGEETKDIIRGPLNQGGLYVERIGATYPNYSIPSSWKSSKSDESCTPFIGISKAGIIAYKTKFTLDIKEYADVPLAFKFERTPTSNYRLMLYVNGWQYGRFISNFGPQTVYPVPEGILNHRGENDILLTLWSLDNEGAKVANAELIAMNVLSSSKEVVRGPVA
ncbi:unnamed protein product [Rhizoctonia solani]|uniref:beta-galactosidase n=1 Tax=Rhizoctonia solani TaxID=456999 RepID=A0A8H3CD98_9AGAM|nr:unnamed protein product [Rhizoctonia solani]